MSTHSDKEAAAHLSLPYPVAFPPWTRYEHPCLTPRPLLAVSAADRSSTPRLYPASLSASLIIPPCTQQPPTPSPPSSPEKEMLRIEKVFDEQISKQRLADWDAPHVPPVAEAVALDQPSSSGPLKRPRPSLRGNLACSALLNSECHAVVAVEGRLDKVTLLQPPGQSEAQLLNIKGTVENAEVRSLCSGGGLLSAISGSHVYICDLERQRWTDAFPLPGAMSAVPSESGIEVACLDSLSVTIRNVSSGRASFKARIEADTQPLNTKSAAFALQYAAHPRVLLAASERRIWQVDTRHALGTAVKCKPVLTPRADWRLPKEDRGVQCMLPVPSCPFLNCVVTGGLLAIVDSRAWKMPVLEWSMPPAPGPYVAACASLRGGSDAVIALAAPVSSQLLVFHMTASGQPTGDLFSDPAPMDDALLIRTFPRPQLLWSDAPLAHLERLPSRAERRGLALIPRGDADIDLVQSSALGGVLTQTVSVMAFRDGEVRFEGEQPMNAVEPETGMQGMDSHANIMNARDSICMAQATEKHWKLREREQDIRALHERDWEPGLGLMQRLRTLDARDAVTILRRIRDDADDESGYDAPFLVPRAMQSDLKAAKALKQRKYEKQETKEDKSKELGNSTENKRARSGHFPTGVLVSQNSASGSEDSDSDKQDLASVIASSSIGNGLLGPELQRVAPKARASRTAARLHTSHIVDTYGSPIPDCLAPERSTPAWAPDIVYTARKSDTNRERAEALPPLPEGTPFAELLQRMRAEFEELAGHKFG